MEENQELQAQEKIINVDIEREMKKSFLDYSMSVIVPARCRMFEMD